MGHSAENDAAWYETPGDATYPEPIAEKDAGRTPEEQLLWDIFSNLGARAHGLIGSAYSCGDWSAQCGSDIPEQWRQHVNAVERASVTPPGTQADYLLDGSPEAVAIVREARGLPPLDTRALDEPDPARLCD